jgi:hypothetical protein
LRFEFERWWCADERAGFNKYGSRSEHKRWRGDLAERVQPTVGLVHAGHYAHAYRR